MKHVKAFLAALGLSALLLAAAPARADTPQATLPSTHQDMILDPVYQVVCMVLHLGLFGSSAPACAKTP
jgi:hypothetical protein